MSDSTQIDFSTDAATIAAGMKVIEKLGRIEVRDGHIGVFRRNGDLIASAPVSSVQVKKTLLYSMMPTIFVIVDGTKFRVNLSYEGSINAGQGDQQARAIQYEDNDRFFATIRALGGQA